MVLQLREWRICFPCVPFVQEENTVLPGKNCQPPWLPRARSSGLGLWPLPVRPAGGKEEMVQAGRTPATRSGHSANSPGAHQHPESSLGS